ncbi:MAG: TetR family transcriptional regulator [Myxococcota bacterium]
MARPKDADSAATFDSIIVAALEVLAEADSPSKLSVRKVAARAEVSLGTIQYYFPTKDSLLEACLDGYYERLALLGQKIVAGATSPAADKAAYIEASVRELYRFVRRERVAVGLRMATNTTKGQLHPQRQAEFMGSAIQAAATALTPFVDIEELDVRLSIQAMASILVRMALMSDTEIQHLTDLDGEEARNAIEDYVVRAAKRLVGLAA